MKIRNLIVLVFFAITFSLQAQDYKSAIGLRLGSPLSLSFKTFISEKAAIEIAAGYRSYSYYNWFNIGGYYQHHMPINSVDGLAWYFGGGVNAYFWSFDDVYYPNNDFSSSSFGLSGCLGLDLSLIHI